VWGVLREVAVPALTAAVLTPLVRRLFLGFLDGDPSTWGDSITQIVFRVQMVVVGWVALDVYGAVVRGRDRDVLALYPIDASRVVRAELLEVAVARWWLVPGAAAVLSPIAFAGAPTAWLAATVALGAAFVGALLISAPVLLLAVLLAESESAAPFLDLVRGHNPRAQAAFLYAPGAVLLGVGVLLVPSAGAVPAAAEGQALGWLALGLPVMPGVASLLALPDLARRTWLRASTVVSEIDARYAALADAEEARRVYLDWAVRWLPPAVGTWALADLRHGWRARRTLVTGAWLLGVGAFAVGWTSDPAGPDRVAIVTVLATFVVAANGVLLAGDEPAFLAVWLPRGAAGAVARAFVLVGWVLPIPVLGAASVAARTSWHAAGQVCAAGGIALAVACALAIVCARRGGAGMVVYAPVAAALAVGLASVVAGR
jgi:hypothetical protein